MYLRRWHGWCHVKLLPSRRVLCTPCNHAPCHFMQSHTSKVHAYLAVPCHLHLWQNDRDLLRAIAVTLGWNGYQNKSQHRKVALEKKILPPLLQGFEPATLQSLGQCSNHRAIPAPRGSISWCVSIIIRLSFYRGYSQTIKKEWVVKKNKSNKQTKQKVHPACANHHIVTLNYPVYWSSDRTAPKNPTSFGCVFV